MPAQLSTQGPDPARNSRPANRKHLTVLPGGVQSGGMHDLPQWSQAIEDYQVWMLAAVLSPGTIYLRLYQLRRLSRDFPGGPWTITTEQLAIWLSSHGWAAGTVRCWRSMLGSFYRWAANTGRVPLSPAATLPRAPRVRLRPRPAPDDVVDEAIGSASRRTALMIALARHGGLRRGEISRVHTDDLTHEADGWWLLVHGKGGKERPVPLDDATVDRLRDWLRGRTGWVFPGDKDGHLAPATVGRLVTKHLTGPWTTHTLRHRYASVTYEGCHDLAAVQDLLGHSKPETTRIYVDVNREALRRAARFAA